MIIEKHNTFIRMRIENDTDARWLRSFLNHELTTYSMVPDYSNMKGGRPKWKKEVNKQFYVVLGRWYHIPAGHLNVLLDSINKSQVKADIEEVKPKYKLSKIKIAMNGYKPRGYQEEGIKRLTTTASPILLNAIYTGGGKTISTFFLMEVFKERTFMCMKPSLIKQWIEEILVKTKLKQDDILHIKDGNEFRALLTKPKVKFKVCIISNALYRNYVKEYIESVQEDEDFSYDINPFDTMGFLKIGCLVIDEVDADFHMWSMMLMTTEVHRVMALSATMVNSNETMAKLYDNFTTKDARYDLFEEHPYISLFNYTYELLNPKIKCTQRGSYNHGVLEDSICKSVSSKNAYMAMVMSAYIVAHKNRCKPGEKCIIYFSKVDTIEFFAEYISERHRDINVLVFVAGISPEEIKKADIVITTAIKASRGLDIAGLTTLINTINIRSIQTNLQLFGRLRMPNPGESEKIAVQVTASNLRKHVDYGTERHSMLKKKVLRTMLVNSNRRI